MRTTLTPVGRAASAGSQSSTEPAPPPHSARAPLAGLLVVQDGARLAASVCGTLLAQLGAEVVFMEAPQSPGSGDLIGRAAHARGKRSVALQPDRSADRAFGESLMGAADVVITSTDVSPPVRSLAANPLQIRCDITAFGATGPLSGLPYPDALVQALSGLADTTGNPRGAPTLIGFPFCEVSAGIYAAAAVVTAHRVRRAQGIGQSIDIALFDCAFGALPTFLPFHVVGKPATRTGNQHSLAAPWNAYPASDGWVLICTATDEQWTRLCGLLGKDGLAKAAGFATNAERATRRDEVDAILQEWTRTLTVRDCIERLSRFEIACGPILTLEQLRTEENLRHRGMVTPLANPAGANTIVVPGSPLAAAMPTLAPSFRVPRPNEDRTYLEELIAGRSRASRDDAGDDRGAAGNLPLQGLRVLEIGQFTTAPLVSRHLGALGAEVLKIEAPGGEGSRPWPPAQGNRGYFFAFSNSDKQSLELDLRAEGGRRIFRNLLRISDVLVENLKPGSLARLGFDAGALHKLNPRLVYCGISGFGMRSAYPGRPAFDTVVQAMSGFMDLTRAGGVPTKAGVSAADILGGEIGLLAILAGLEMRDASGQGEAIDVSMQDAAVWATSSLWTGAPDTDTTMVRCADGYVCAACSDARLASTPGLALQEKRLASSLSRDAFVEAAAKAGIVSAAVLTVSEAALSPQATARQLMIEKSTPDGRRWPLLNCPIRLSVTPPVVRRAIGELGEANEAIEQVLRSGSD